MKENYQKYNYRKYKLKIKTHSPLFIGSGDYLSSTGEYLITTERVIFLDNEKLISEIKKKDKLIEYIEKITSESTNFNLENILKEWGINFNDYIIRELEIHQKGININANNILNLCIKTDSKAYIPGSSIKGMVRTAMLYKLLNDNSTIKKNIENDIKRELNKKHPLNSLRKYWADKGKKLIPNDVANAFRPKDSDSIDDKMLAVEQMHRMNFFSKESDSLDWLSECIKQDVEVSNNLEIFSHFSNSNFEYLHDLDIGLFYKIINDYTLKNIDFEIELLKKVQSSFENKEKVLRQLLTYKEIIENSGNDLAIFRLGRGKTFFFQTLLLTIKDELRDKIIDLIKKEDGEFPRTRVLTVKDDKMIGWLELKMEKVESKIIEPEFLNNTKTELQPKEKNNISRKKKSQKEIDEERKKEKQQKKQYEQLAAEKIKDKFIDNNVDKIEIKKTILKVIYLGNKKVNLLINGTKYTNIQIILLHKKQVFETGEILDVIVWNISKDGRVTVVKLKK